MKLNEPVAQNSRRQNSWLQAYHTNKLFSDLLRATQSDREISWFECKRDGRRNRQTLDKPN